jgi:hypothetical protein
VADHVKKRKMCKKLLVAADMMCTLGLCSLNVQNKLTAVTEQKNVVSLEEGIQRWKQLKLELAPVLCKNCHFCGFKDGMEYQFCALSFFSERKKN